MLNDSLCTLRNVLNVAEDRVAAFYRGKHGDMALGSTNSTLSVVDGNPVLYMNDGSPCPNAGDNNNMLANTAIRFLCDTTSLFGDGQSVKGMHNAITDIGHPTGEPQLIAQFPADDEHACSFYFEWRTRVSISWIICIVKLTLGSMHVPRAKSQPACYTYL